MAQNNRLRFNLIKIFLSGVKASLDDCMEAIQDGRLANYVLKELKRKQRLYTREFFVVPTVENTSVLRDYVHHKLTKEHENLEKVDRKVGKLRVLKWLEDKKYRVQCGGLARM